MKVLIIEDDANVMEAIALCLQLRWPEVNISITPEGIEGIARIRTAKIKSGPFDIVILDLNLPDIDGFEVLKRIRSFSNVPILIVSVRGREEDQAKGLEMGADDYVVKPFRPRDLVARINSVLRRSSISAVDEESQSIIRGKLTLRLVDSEAQLGGEITKLTPNESRLLYVLMKNAEHTLSSEHIIQEVWGRESAATDIVRTYVRRLRDKLKDKPPQIILNQRGGGYRFVEPR
ncbi:response regulator transcription factor [Chloroflexota bacterium]